MASQPDYTQTWFGLGTRGNREVNFEIAVRVAQGGTASFAMPADGPREARTRNAEARPDPSPGTRRPRRGVLLGRATGRDDPDGRGRTRMLDRVGRASPAPGDFDGLLLMGDGNCRRHLEMAGRDAVPPDPPTVVGTRTIPTTTTAGDQTAPWRHRPDPVRHRRPTGSTTTPRCWSSTAASGLEVDQPRLLGTHEDRRQRQPGDGRDVPAGDLLTRVGGILDL